MKDQAVGNSASGKRNFQIKPVRAVLRSSLQKCDLQRAKLVGEDLRKRAEFPSSTCFQTPPLPPSFISRCVTISECATPVTDGGGNGNEA